MKVKDFKLGATGKYPHGKLNADDEGELRLAVAADPRNRTVVIAFGKPISWLGLPVSQAKELANILNQKVAEVEKKGS